MKKYQKIKLMKNIIVLVIVVLGFLGVGLGYHMMSYGVSVDKAFEILKKNIAVDLKELVGGDTEMVAEESGYDYYRGDIYQENNFIGDQYGIPAGVYTFLYNTGDGFGEFFLYENGELIKEWKIAETESADCFSVLKGVELKEGQILSSRGSIRVSIVSETKLKYTTLIAPTYRTKSYSLSDGEYVIGEDIISGLARINLPMDSTDVVRVTTSNVAEGGVDVKLYRVEYNPYLPVLTWCYNNVLLKEGETLVISGGTVDISVVIDE